MHTRTIAAAWAFAAAAVSTGSVAQGDAGYLKSTDNVARIQRGNLYVSFSASDGIVREVIQQAAYRFSP